MVFIIYLNHRKPLNTQVLRRPLDRRTSTQLTEVPPSKEKTEVDALSASCVADEEQEEVAAASASCIEDEEEDDMFAIATQGTGVVDETVDTTTEKTLDNTAGGEQVAEEGLQESSSVPDSMGLLEQETAPLNGEEEEGMFFHNLEKQDAVRIRQTTPSLTNDSALLGADTQAVVGQPNESSLLFGEPTQVF